MGYVNKYTNDQVRHLQEVRNNLKSPIRAYTDEEWIERLGRIQGAGHLEFTDLKHDGYEQSESGRKTDYYINFAGNSRNGSMNSERPHIEGYVKTPEGGEAKISGWWNPEEQRFRFEMTQ